MGTSRKTKRQPSVKGDKKNRHGNQKGVSWEAEKKEDEQSISGQNLGMGCGIFFLVLMVYLFFFVDDEQTIAQREDLAKKEAKKQAKMSAPPPPFNFEYTKEVDLEDLNTLMTGDDMPEILILSLASSEGSTPATPPKEWKKWERLKKAMVKAKGQAKRFENYDKFDLPTTIRFDCAGEGAPACEAFQQNAGVRENDARGVIFRSQGGQLAPKAFPNDVRSDKQIFTYLFDLMQPAVKYFGDENDNTAEFSDFVDPEDDIPRVVLFGDTEEDEWKKFMAIADDLREFAKFGRTKEDELIQEFCGDESADAMDDDVVKMYRKFDGEDGGASVLDYTGDYTDREAVTKWVKDNSLPLLVEFSGKIRQRIQNRGLPIVWIHIDSGADTKDGNETDELLKQAKAVAESKRGEYTFTYVDSMTNEKFAKELGATTAPEVMILSQNNEVRKDIKEDDVAGSINRAIADYKTGGQQSQYNVDDDSDDSSDEDYDDDDEADVSDTKVASAQQPGADAEEEDDDSSGDDYDDDAAPAVQEDAPAAQDDASDSEDLEDEEVKPDL